MQKIIAGRRIERAEKIRNKAIKILQRNIENSVCDLSHRDPDRRKIAETQISGWQEKIDTLASMNHAEEILHKIRLEYFLDEAFEV
jgi:vacuolar-type H+-ATPase subunit E/Vma4